MAFIHGIETITVDSGPRSIELIRSSVIGLVGTAPAADAAKFPLNTPVLVNSRGGYSAIGVTGTLKDSLNGIFDQGNAAVVVIRVEVGADDSATMANIIGGANAQTGALTGIYAFREAQSLVGVSPMILIAPGFTGERPTGVISTAITTPGSGYTSAPTVTFTGGGTEVGKVLPTGVAVLGTGADAQKVVGITLTNKGAKLTAAPTIAFTGGGGTLAAATATIGAYSNPVVSALLTMANSLRAHVVAEGPNTTDSAALAYRSDWGSRRVYIVDPAVMVFDTDLETPAYVAKPNSPRVAGLIARIDSQVGFWKSPSNETINGIGGITRQIDYSLGDPTSRANILNENEVTTIIRDDGWRLWGNRTASDDPKWAFLSVSRTADMIDISIQQGHRWAVDKVVNKQYFEDVVASVNGFLRQLQARGAILGGRCWADPDFNTPADIAAGKVTFSYDFTPPTPAEHITFRSAVTIEYISSIFAV